MCDGRSRPVSGDGRPTRWRSTSCCGSTRATPIRPSSRVSRSPGGAGHQVGQQVSRGPVVSSAATAAAVRTSRLSLCRLASTSAAAVTGSGCVDQPVHQPTLVAAGTGAALQVGGRRGRPPAVPRRAATAIGSARPQAAGRSGRPSASAYPPGPPPRRRRAERQHDGRLAQRASRPRPRRRPGREWALQRVRRRGCLQVESDLRTVRGARGSSGYHRLSGPVHARRPGPLQHRGRPFSVRGSRHPKVVDSRDPQRCPRLACHRLRESAVGRREGGGGAQHDRGDHAAAPASRVGASTAGRGPAARPAPGLRRAGPVSLPAGIYTALDVTIIRTPVRAPRANAHRRTLSSAPSVAKLLEHILIINQRHGPLMLCNYELSTTAAPQPLRRSIDKTLLVSCN